MSSSVDPSGTAPAAVPSTSTAAADASGAAWLAELRAGFGQLRAKAERAVAQLDDADLWHALDPEANPVGVLLRHVGGNLRSRFTDFRTTDGEKPDRDRDAEFVVPADRSRAATLAVWTAGWTALEDTLAALAPADLARTVTIRGEPCSVGQALGRAERHVAEHVGQIVLLAKHRRGAAWRTLSIPRGGSAAFLAEMRARFEGGAPTSGSEARAAPSAVRHGRS